MLLDRQTIVVCSGGGGVPVVAVKGTGHIRGVEAVVDKDFTASLLARQLDADVLLLLTDVATVQDGYGAPQARPIRRATPAELRARNFPGRVDGTPDRGRLPLRRGDRKLAAIGRLGDTQALLAGQAGILIAPAQAAARPGRGA